MILSLLMLIAAQDAPNCDSPVTQLEMNECAYLDYQKADAEMNAQWRKTLAAMRAGDKEMGPDNFGPPSAQLLLNSQRAWLTYRDAQCEVEGDSARGGSMQSMLVSECKTLLTGERTETLRKLIEEQ